MNYRRKQVRNNKICSRYKDQVPAYLANIRVKLYGIIADLCEKSRKEILTKYLTQQCKNNHYDITKFLKKLTGRQLSAYILPLGFSIICRWLLRPAQAQAQAQACGIVTFHSVRLGYPQYWRKSAIWKEVSLRMNHSKVCT